MKSPPANTVRTQIKVCGFTRPADAVSAVTLGVDALGLVFYSPSSRHLDIAQAQEIAAVIPPFVTLTALFLNAEREYINQVLSEVPVSLLQFHGTESGEFCQSFDRPYIKSIPMKSIRDVHSYCSGFAKARGFLLDSNAAGAAGGSGDVFDWSRVPTNTTAPLVLAGGLGVRNVRQAILSVKPCGVDLSSGVETAKGIKDNALMQQFVAQVRAADCELNNSAA